MERRLPFRCENTEVIWHHRPKSTWGLTWFLCHQYHSLNPDKQVQRSATCCHSHLTWKLFNVPSGVVSHAILPCHAHRLDCLSQSVLPVLAPVLALLQLLITGRQLFQSQHRLWKVKGQTCLLHCCLKLGRRSSCNVTSVTREKWT